MTIEKKAKAYDEAIRKAKDMLAYKEVRQEDIEYLFPELKEREDKKIRKDLIVYLRSILSNKKYGDKFIEDWIAWLEKQGEKADEWKEGDVVRHGGIFALVINGRNAMKSNHERITIQYPDEWVKAEPKEREHFFEELEKQGEQKPTDRVKLKFKTN